MPQRLKAREIRGKPRGPVVDLTGHRFGKLVALKVQGMHHGRTYWLFQCDCGQKTRVAMGTLRRGATKSCGCLRRLPPMPPEYAWWVRRVRRNTTFRNFEAFYRCVGRRPSPNHQLRRPNPQQPFGPRNCEWSLFRSGRRIIQHQGRRLTLSEWAARLGISKQALSHRLSKHKPAIALSPRTAQAGPIRKATGQLARSSIEPASFPSAAKTRSPDRYPPGSASKMTSRVSQRTQPLSSGSVRMLTNTVPRRPTALVGSCLQSIRFKTRPLAVATNCTSPVPTGP
jgi:hypothetical protein